VASKTVKGVSLDFCRGKNWVGFCQELLRLNSAFDSAAALEEGCGPRFQKNALSWGASSFGCQQPVFAEAPSRFFDLSRSSGFIILMQIRLRVSIVRQPKTQAPQICRLLIMYTGLKNLSAFHFPMLIMLPL